MNIQEFKEDGFNLNDFAAFNYEEVHPYCESCEQGLEEGQHHKAIYGRATYYLCDTCFTNLKAEQTAENEANNQKDLAFSYDPVEMLCLMYRTFTCNLTTDAVFYQTLAHDNVDNLVELLEDYVEVNNVTSISDPAQFNADFHAYLVNKIASSDEAYFKQARVEIFTNNKSKNGVIDNRTLEIIECEFGGHFAALSIFLEREGTKMYHDYLRACSSPKINSIADFTALDEHVKKNFTFVRSIEKIGWMD